MIVGISGKFASGKDTLAFHLVKNHGFSQGSFAAKLKDVCVDLFGMTIKNRDLLQHVGVAMRNVDPDVWVKYALANISHADDVVFSDMRFPNEAHAIRSRGGVLIRLDCPTPIRIGRYLDVYGHHPTVDQQHHVSETALDDEPSLWNHVIDSSRPIAECFADMDKIIAFHTTPKESA
jgi:hypothetical protein